jgi:adenine/guanine phosphoribosyltransferase-like PRPP-binding protein
MRTPFRTVSAGYADGVKSPANANATRANPDIAAKTRSSVIDDFDARGNAARNLLNMIQFAAITPTITRHITRKDGLNSTSVVRTVAPEAFISFP